MQSKPKVGKPLTTGMNMLISILMPRYAQDVFVHTLTNRLLEVLQRLILPLQIFLYKYVLLDTVSVIECMSARYNNHYDGDLDSSTEYEVKHQELKNHNQNTLRMKRSEIRDKFKRLCYTAQKNNQTSIEMSESTHSINSENSEEKLNIVSSNLNNVTLLHDLSIIDGHCDSIEQIRLYIWERFGFLLGYNDKKRSKYALKNVEFDINTELGDTLLEVKNFIKILSEILISKSSEEFSVFNNNQNRNNLNNSTTTDSIKSDNNINLQLEKLCYYLYAIVLGVQSIQPIEGGDDYGIKIECLKKADIVFSTLATSGQSMIQSCLQRREFDFVLIDEAAQILEPELTNVLALNPRNMVQVGDFKQLPATVFSMETQRSGRHMSCMQRLVEKCRHPSFFLDTQYRMHPEILQFPNRMFYNNALRTDTSVLARKKLQISSQFASHNAPWLSGYAFIDFAEGQEQSSQSSVSNAEEAKCVVKLVQYLSKVYPTAKINIITFYSAQMKCISTHLTRQHASRLARVFTVDSFQGSESDIILLSFVRANAGNRVGFVKDYQRLNVALTRAKHLLLCVGHASTLAGRHSLHRQRQSQSADSKVTAAATAADTHDISSNLDALQLLVNDSIERDRLFEWKSEVFPYIHG